MACCGSKPKAASDRASRRVVKPGTADDLGPNTQPDGPRAAVVHTGESLPPSLQYWPNGTDRYIRVSKSTYPANNPNEDRCTFAADTETGYIFAGVWDGHGAFDPHRPAVATARPKGCTPLNAAHCCCSW